MRSNRLAIRACYLARRAAIRSSTRRQIPSSRFPLVRSFSSEIEVRSSTQKLLDKDFYPKGSPDLVGEVDSVLHFWWQQETSVAVHASWNLVERLAEEGTHQHVLEGALDHWKRVWHKEPVHGFSPRDVLERMDALPSVEWSESLYRALIHAEMRRGNRSRIADSTLELLHRCAAEYQAGNEACRPSEQIVYTCLRAQARSQRVDYIDRVQSLLQRMPSFGVPVSDRAYHEVLLGCTSLGADGARLAFDFFPRIPSPSIECYTTAIACWREHRREGAGRAEDLMRRFQQQFTVDELKAKEAVAPFNATLSCLSNVGMTKAEKLFSWMKANDLVNMVSYRTMISSYSRNGQAEECERLLLEMSQLHKLHPERQIQPVQKDLILSVLAWSRSDQGSDCYERACALSDRIQNELGIERSTDTYNALLLVLKESKRSFVAQEAQKLVDSMRQSGDSAIAPNEETYQVLISIFADYGLGDMAASCVKLMSEDSDKYPLLKKPSLKTLNLVLSSFVKAKDHNAGQAALNFLQEIEELSRAGSLDFKPDEYSYAIVISALVNSKGDPNEIARSAERVLRYMARSRYLRPTTMTYNPVLNGWANAKNPARTAAIIQEMYAASRDGSPKAEPDKHSFNALVKAWAHSGEVEAPQKVEEILQHMTTLSNTLDVRPDVVSYTTLLLAYAMSPQSPATAPRADAVVEHMKALYRKGELEEGPNVKTLETLRTIWLKSRHPQKRTRVSEIEHELNEMRAHTTRFHRKSSSASSS